MGKAMLISVKPKYVADILNGKKTIEIRKTCPARFKNLKLYEGAEPIEVYIYCTKEEFPEVVLYSQENMYGGYMEHVGNGKVVAKFTLNKVEKIKEDESCGLLWSQTMIEETLLKASCLTQEELYDYLSVSIGCDNDGWVYGYAWHIDNLVIFDKPKELSDFYGAFTQKRYERIFGNNAVELDKECGGLRQPTKSGYEYTYPLTRAPQSWCYIEV